MEKQDKYLYSIIFKSNLNVERYGMKIREKKVKIDKYAVILVLSMGVLHFITNLFVKTLSFSSDEFIPLSIAAYLSGHDWLHARKMDYYYGYVSLFFYIPILKCKFIYSNTFLLTQCLLAINSVFHIIQTYFIYKSVLNYTQDKTSKKQAAFLSFICCNILQLFATGMGVQIESLFCLSFIASFYIITKYLKVKTKVSCIMLALLGIVAYAENSRGIVLIIANLLIIVFTCMNVEKKNIKKVFVFILAFIIFYILHLLIKTEYLQFWQLEENVKNTDNSSIVKKILLLLHSDYLNVYFKLILTWIWSACVSTYGILSISLFMVVYAIINNFKEKDNKNIEVALYVFIVFFGTLILTSISAVTAAYSYIMESSGDRCDVMFYVRYLVSSLAPLLIIGLIEFINNRTKIINGIYIILAVQILFIYIYKSVFEHINGLRYGINNSVYLSLFQNDYIENYRYGYVSNSNFIIAQLILNIFLILMILFWNRKDIFIYIISVISIITIFVYTVKIPANRSEYYWNYFDKDIVSYCNASEYETVYVCQEAPTAQYMMPDKIVYYSDINSQDLLLVTTDKVSKINLQHYKRVMKKNGWELYERK